MTPSRDTPEEPILTTLSDDRLLELFGQEALPDWYLPRLPTTPPRAPKAIVIGGQPGAGKTSARKILAPPRDFATVNGDDLRAFHPQFALTSSTATATPCTNLAARTAPTAQLLPAGSSQTRWRPSCAVRWRGPRRRSWRCHRGPDAKAPCRSLTSSLSASTGTPPAPTPAEHRSARRLPHLTASG